MDTTHSGVAQAGTHHVVPDPWRPMSDAPTDDLGFCCDIWSGTEQRRYTDCFWDRTQWCHETFNAGYRVYPVPDPVAFIPVPGAPTLEVLR